MFKNRSCYSLQTDMIKLRNRLSETYRGIKMNMREEVLKYLIHYLKYDIGFTEVGLADKTNTEKDIAKMKSLKRKYKAMIKYAEENLK